MIQMKASPNNSKEAILMPKLEAMQMPKQELMPEPLKINGTFSSLSATIFSKLHLIPKKKPEQVTPLSMTKILKCASFYIIEAKSLKNKQGVRIR